MEYCQLNYKRFGEEGSVVVILHGLFGMLDNWKSFARHLSAHHIVYIVDLRNHGKSCHLDEMDYNLMGEDVKTFLEEHSLTDVLLMGHSMGGKVAMNIALKYPNLIEKLVVVDIAPKKYKPTHLPIFDALLSIDLTQPTKRKEVAEKLLQKIKDPSIVQFLMKNLKREAEQQYRWKFNLSIIRQNYEKIIDQENGCGVYPRPVLFVKGDNSAYISLTDIDRITDLFPQAKIHIIKKAGHWVHAEQPKLLLEVVNTFLQD